MVVVPRGEQPATNQVVDLALVGVQRNTGGRRHGGYDGVMVGDAVVVYETAPQRPAAGAGRHVITKRLSDNVAHTAKRSGNIACQMATVGSWVGNKLCAFIQHLCQLQGPVAAKTEQAIGVALKFREIVQ